MNHDPYQVTFSIYGVLAWGGVGFYFVDVGNDSVPEARKAIVPDEVGKWKNTIRYGEGNQLITGPSLHGHSSFSSSKITAGLESLGSREARGL